MIPSYTAHANFVDQGTWGGVSGILYLIFFSEVGQERKSLRDA